MNIDMGSQEPEEKMSPEELRKHHDNFFDKLAGLISDFGVSLEATIKFHDHNGDVIKISEVAA